MAAALLGVPGIQTQTQFFNSGGTRTASDNRLLVQHEYGAFVQDSWKVRNNLTLQLGMRYEFNGVPFERNGNLSNLLNQQPYDPGPITFQTVGPGTGRQMYKDDYKDFEPRVGLAWDPFKDGKTSFRMGYGIFHDRIFGNLFGNLRGDPPFEGTAQNFPNAGSQLVTLATLTPPATLPAPSASVPEGTYQSATILDPNLKTPYTQSWNVGIQRDLGHHMTLEVNYVGSSSHRLIRSVDGNPPIPALVAAAQANGSLDPTISGGTLRILPLAWVTPSDRKHRIRRADRNQIDWKRHLQRTANHRSTSDSATESTSRLPTPGPTPSTIPTTPCRRRAETATLREILSICTWTEEARTTI